MLEGFYSLNPEGFSFSEEYAFGQFNKCLKRLIGLYKKFSNTEISNTLDSIDDQWMVCINHLIAKSQGKDEASAFIRFGMLYKTFRINYRDAYIGGSTSSINILAVYDNLACIVMCEVAFALAYNRDACVIFSSYNRQIVNVLNNLLVRTLCLNDLEISYINHCNLHRMESTSFFRKASVNGGASLNK